MSTVDPIELLYGGMDKLGPGNSTDTLKALDMLPKQTYPLIVDAGCGSGRQSLVLAKQMRTTINAVDSYEPFLKSLEKRARENGIEDFIQTHCMDMAEIPGSFQGIDLLWSESAAYSIGFVNALDIWWDAIKPSGLLVVSELSWLHNEAPAEVAQFFESAYPDMRSEVENRRVIKNAGYKVLFTHTLPDETWVDGYYEILGPRAE